MIITHKNQGTCSRSVQIEIENDTIINVQFEGGCNGNTQGVAALCRGRRVDEVIDLCAGIRCGFKPTSCPDQLAQALMQYRAEKG